MSASPVKAQAAPAVKKAYSEEAIKHYNKGVELHQSGFLNQAIAEYRAAIESDDRMEEAWSNLGGIYAAQKSYTKALEAFQKALTLKPDRPTTLNGLGTVLYAKNRIEDAKKMWTQATIADPKFASAYYNMANALENEKKIPEAVQQYVKAIDVNPSMGDSFYRIATIYLKEQHAAQARVMFAKAVALGPDAEYIRDAKKQLAALDASFATDVLDHHESREGKVEQPPAARSSGTTGTAANARPKQEPPTTTDAETPRPRIKPVKQAPVKETATEAAPPVTTGGGVNITTDENGRGTVVEPNTPKRKKKTRSENVAKKAKPTPEETVTTTAPPPAESTAVTNPPQAQPEATNTTPAPTTDAAATPAPEVAAEKPKRKRKTKMRLEDVAKTAPPPTEEQPAQTAPAPGAESTATRTPEAMPTQDLVPTPDNLQPGKDVVASPEAPQTQPTTEASEPNRSATSDLTGMTDDAPKKRARKHEKKGHEDLARTFIVPPQESTEANGATPTSPAEDVNNAQVPAQTQAAAAGADESANTAAATSKKKKALFSRRTKSVKESTIYKTIEPDAGDVSDLKEKPPETAPGETTPEMMQN